MGRRLVQVFALLGTIVLPGAHLVAQDPAPDVIVSPDHSRLLLMERNPGAAAEASATMEFRLAGQRFNPRTSTEIREVTYSALVVQPIGRGEIRRLVVPWKAKVSGAIWSPDGNRIALTMIEDAGTSLWVGDPVTGDIRMLVGPVLNAVSGPPCQWLSSGSALVCTRLVSNRGPAPASDSRSLELLQNSQDEALFEHYFSSQIVLVPLSGGERPIGSPGIHRDIAVSPNGKFLTVATMHRPFSAQVPVEGFPLRTEVWDMSDGSVVKVVHDRGLVESLPAAPDAVPAGPRSVGWRGDQPATLVWVEAQDGGDPSQAAAIRDKVFQLPAPFTGKASALASLEFRSRGVSWGGEDLVVVSEGWAKSRTARIWAVNPSKGGPPRLIVERTARDRSADAGRFLTQTGRTGGEVLVTAEAGRFAFLTGSSAAGEAAFLDRVELATGKVTRLWRAEGPGREEAVAMMDVEKGRVITRRESATEPANYFIRDVWKSGPQRLTPLTRFVGSGAGVQASRVRANP